MRVIILAAGYATRLRPLTTNTSKSLLEVGKKKIIDRILEKIGPIKKAVDSMYIITNEKFFKNFNDWLKATRYGDKVFLINDGSTTNENRLGAINDLAVVVRDRAIEDDLLVVAGDNLFEFSLDKFLKFAKAHPDGVTIALYDIKDPELAKSFGVVEIDAHDRIVDFQEKPSNPKSTLVSTGVYYFPKEKISFIGEYVKMKKGFDAPGHYIGWLSQADKVYGFRFKEDWYDIGNIESYKNADNEYLKRERENNDEA